MPARIVHRRGSGKLRRRNAARARRAAAAGQPTDLDQRPAPQRRRSPARLQTEAASRRQPDRKTTKRGGEGPQPPVGYQAIEDAPR